jgi:hypothetical protein
MKQTISMIATMLADGIMWGKLRSIFMEKIGLKTFQP